MKLRAIKGKLTDRRDRLRYCRSDGSSIEIDLPRQGILPHDLVHCVLEAGFGLRGGFMARVADGASPEFQSSKAMLSTPELSIAESMVEAMQTQLAQGSLDFEAFVYGVTTACRARGIDGIPPLDPDLTAQIFADCQALNARWRALAPTQALDVIFLEPAR
jgi:hypothetical protein